VRGVSNLLVVMVSFDKGGTFYSMKKVNVIWEDIMTLDHSWKNVAECVEEARKLRNLRFSTIGYLIYEDREFVLVASTHDGEDEWNDVSLIMRSVIKEIKEL
jgi:hypothetical protein